jgi:hypothetical protein
MRSNPRGTGSPSLAIGGGAIATIAPLLALGDRRRNPTIAFLGILVENSNDDKVDGWVEEA